MSSVESLVFPMLNERKKGFVVNIVVIGDLSTGKSTLVNSIIQCDFSYCNKRCCNSSVQRFTKSYTYNDDEGNLSNFQIKDCSNSNLMQITTNRVKESTLVPRTCKLNLHTALQLLCNYFDTALTPIYH